jgi:hypothetical protein
LVVLCQEARTKRHDNKSYQGEHDVLSGHAIGRQVIDIGVDLVSFHVRPRLAHGLSSEYFGENVPYIDEGHSLQKNDGPQDADGNKRACISGSGFRISELDPLIEKLPAFGADSRVNWGFVHLARL